MPPAHIAFIASLIVAPLIIGAPSQEIAIVSKGNERAVIALGVPSEEHPFRSGSLPFTAADAIHYFSTALEMSSEKAPNGGTVFENLHDPQPEDFWRIEVRTDEKELIVEFTVGGDYGLTLAREFFECPLFERDEFERFYEMLNSAKNDPVEKLRRYIVKMTLRDAKETQVLTLRFTPRES